jgi:hypothetical protein
VNDGTPQSAILLPVCTEEAINAVLNRIKIRSIKGNVVSMDVVAAGRREPAATLRAPARRRTRSLPRFYFTFLIVAVGLDHRQNQTFVRFGLCSTKASGAAWRLHHADRLRGRPPSFCQRSTLAAKLTTSSWVHWDYAAELLLKAAQTRKKSDIEAATAQMERVLHRDNGL